MQVGAPPPPAELRVEVGEENEGVGGGSSERGRFLKFLKLTPQEKKEAAA